MNANMNEMQSEYYLLLKKLKVKPNNFLEKLESWNSTQILDFAKNAFHTLLYSPKEPKSIFTFAANSSLSGSPFPCANPECRLHKLDSMARFAALYGDIVYITNPFEKYFHLKDINDFTRWHLTGDILGMYYLKPLFDAGLLSIRSNIFYMCKEHNEDLTEFENSIKKRLRKVDRLLEREYLHEIKVYLVNNEGEVFISFNGPEELIDHGGLDLVGDISGPMTTGLLSNQRRKLSRREIREGRLLDWFINPVLNDLFQQNVHVIMAESQYLTDRELDLKLASLINDPKVSEMSEGLVSGISHSVPTLEEIPINKLIELRKKEGEAFEVYRDSLTKALKVSKNLTKQQISELIDDQVRPEIHKIELSIKNNKKLLTGSLKKDLFVGAGYIAVSLFSGLISPEVSAIIATLGGHSFVDSLVEKIKDMKSTPENVIENPYYFLWKVKDVRRSD